MGYYQINTGGLVTALGHSIKGADGQWRPSTRDDLQNDRGSTHTVGYQEIPEPRYTQKEREMTNRAREYYGNGHSESAIEREIWKQIGGSYQGEFNANVERGLRKLSMEADRTRQLSAELFNQIANAPR